MKTDDIPSRSPRPWVPERDIVLLALFGKAVEEGGEFVAKLGRCIVQGIDGLDPDTDLPQNRGDLADEAADLTTLFRFLASRLTLDAEAMEMRVQRKTVFLEAWLKSLERIVVAVDIGAAAPLRARPEAEWHEDDGAVLWWSFPVSEPPYVGSPLDLDWPGYHTHWTPLGPFPEPAE